MALYSSYVLTDATYLTTASWFPFNARYIYMLLCERLLLIDLFYSFVSSQGTLVKEITENRIHMFFPEKTHTTLPVKYIRIP